VASMLARTKSWFMEDGKLKTFWVVALVIAVAFAALQRVTGNLPNIMGDELVYSSASLHQKLSEVGIPDYLYYWTYSSVGACGIGFYGCSQVLNVAFSLGAGLLVYSIGVRYAPAWATVMIAVFFVLGPLSAYNSYFMPEAMYFFFFALVVWNVTRPTGQRPVVFWLINGGLLGLLSLVKPHGLLLAPAIVTYVLIVQLVAGRGWVVRWLRDSAAFGVAALVVKFFGGLMLAGPAGMTLFGSYAAGGSVSGNSAAGAAGAAFKFAAGTGVNVVSAGASGASHFGTAALAPGGSLAAAAAGSDAFGFIAGMTWIEIAAVGLLALLPLAATIAVAIRTPKVSSATVGDVDGGLESAHNGTWKLAVLALSILVWMAPLIAAFAQRQAVAGEDTANRIMLRYMEFLIPLFLIPLASYAKGFKGAALGRWIGLVIALVLGIAGYAGVTATDATGAPAHNLMFADSAFLKLWAGTASTDASGAQVHWFGVLVLILGIVGGLLWAALPKLGARVWVALVLPILMIISANVLVANPVWRSTNTMSADTAGMLTRDLVPAREYANLMIVSTTSGGKTSELAKFYVNDPSVQVATVTDGSDYAIPAGSGIKWVLVLGRLTLTNPGYVVAQAKGFELVRLNTGDVAFFGNDTSVSPLIAGTTGLDKKTSLGVCATKTPATVTLNKPLPANSQLALGISGSAGLPNEQVTIGFGDASGSITLNSPNVPYDLVLNSTNTTPTNTLTFTLPQQAGAGMCLNYLQVLK